MRPIRKSSTSRYGKSGSCLWVLRRFICFVFPYLFISTNGDQLIPRTCSTYYPTYCSSFFLLIVLPLDHLLLASAPNRGPFMSRWEINKLENCLYKSVSILEVLKLLLRQFLNLTSSQRDMSGPILGDLSNNRWSWGIYITFFSHNLCYFVYYIGWNSFYEEEAGRLRQESRRVGGFAQGGQDWTPARAASCKSRRHGRKALLGETDKERSRGERGVAKGSPSHLMIDIKSFKRYNKLTTRSTSQCCSASFELPHVLITGATLGA